MEKHFAILDIVLAHRFFSHAGWIGEEYYAGRPYHGLVYVESGEADYRFGPKVRFRARAGDLIYLPKGEGYVVECDPAQPFNHMTVNFRMSEQDAQLDLPVIQQVRNTIRVEQLFGKLVSVWVARRQHYHLVCLGHLYELIYAALREKESSHEVYRKKLAPAVEYIEANFFQPGPLPDLPTMCGMSATYFRRLFQRVYKETVSGYITRLRMGYACDLLLSKKYTVSQVAFLCGYEDSAYFSRVFKRIYSTPPSQYDLKWES